MKSVKYSLKLFTVFGIPIELHVSFLILMLFIYAVAALNLFPGINLLLAVLITLVFVTVVIHELSHSYVAQRYGVKIERIVLLPIGGVSAMEEIPKDPGQEFRIAVAGPATNFVIAGVCYIMVFLGASYLSANLQDAIYYFALVNLILGGFNMLPAFPMDGGRVLRAYLAGRMSYVRATRLAANIGKQLAIIMAIVGVFYNIFLILIAVFIYIGAEQEYRTIMVSTLLEGITVGNVMTREVQTVSPETPISEVLNLMFQKKHMGYPVLENGNLVGILTFHDVSGVAPDRRSEAVRFFMTREIISTYPEEPVTDALERLNRKQIGRLPVLSEGFLVGIISKTDILRAVEVMNLKIGE